MPDVLPESPLFISVLFLDDKGGPLAVSAEQTANLMHVQAQQPGHPPELSASLRPSLPRGIVLVKPAANRLVVFPGDAPYAQMRALERPVKGKRERRRVIVAQWWSARPLHTVDSLEMNQNRGQGGIISDGDARTDSSASRPGGASARCKSSSSRGAMMLLPEDDLDDSIVVSEGLTGDELRQWSEGTIPRSLRHRLKAVLGDESTAGAILQYDGAQNGANLNEAPVGPPWWI